LTAINAVKGRRSDECLAGESRKQKMGLQRVKGASSTTLGLLEGKPTRMGNRTMSERQRPEKEWLLFLSTLIQPDS
jgi:hypothetical protein